VYLSKRLLGVLLGVCVLIGALGVVVGSDSLQAHVVFWWLTLQNDDEASRGPAKWLSRSPCGVRLAVEDISSYGGKTGGWSSSILATSTLNSEVEQSLAPIIRSESAPLDKKVAAIWIMWQRTRSPEYLTTLFRAVQGPGDIPVHHGRLLLWQALQPDADIAETIRDIRQDKGLTVSLEEFQKVTANPGWLRAQCGGPRVP
jgi:hypothetical protein